MKDSAELRIKPISEDAVAQALKKAEHYRLLNDPEQAESICRDILRVCPDHEQALVTIVLALTDQFSNNHGTPVAKTAREYVDKLHDEYHRVYYSGLIAERQGRALLERGPARVFAHDAFREAMECYERAEDIRPHGNDESILRWNSCLRTIRRAKLRPHVEEAELPLE